VVVRIEMFDTENSKELSHSYCEGHLNRRLSQRELSLLLKCLLSNLILFRFEVRGEKSVANGT